MKRDQVEERYKWRTEDIFESDEAWEASFKQVDEGYDLTCFVGKLGDRDMLLKYFKTTEELEQKLMFLAEYANLKHDEDVSVSKYMIYFGKINSIFTKYSTMLSFAEPEMSKLDESYLNELVKDKEFAPYDYQIKRIIEKKPHVLSEKEERLLNMAGECFDSFNEIFSMIDDADLKLPEIEWEGEKVKLTQGLYGLILHSDNREKRKEVYDILYSAYGSLINTLTSTYFGNVKKDVFLSKAHKFNSCLESALFYEDVKREVYDNLIESVDENLSSLHRYVGDRKKILGVDKLCFYDMYAPLVDGVQVKMSYDEAYDYVIKGLAPLGQEYADLLKKGHDERWIDVMETENKRSGAYSAGCFGLHPFVLLNYQPTISDIFTIAHEMGHSLHTYFSTKNQPFAKSDYKIFVAEVASTVNEVLLLKFMLNDAKDIELKKYLLNYYLDSIRATLHRQTMFAEFEYLAHKRYEDGEPLTRENLCELYEELGKKYYGTEIEHDDKIKLEWARIPHFYRSFYVYKYATGITAAINIAKRILTEGESAVKDYFKFLSSGSSSDPVSLLRLAGVDLESKEPFKVAMKEFESVLQEFEKLMGI